MLLFEHTIQWQGKSLENIILRENLRYASHVEDAQPMVDQEENIQDGGTSTRDR